MGLYKSLINCSMTSGMQKLADKNISPEKRDSINASFYTGGLCKKFKVNREPVWQLTKAEYRSNVWPYFCGGFLNIYSSDMIRKLIEICPYHCIGLKNNEKFNPNSTCVYKYEDTFFGSCVQTMSNIFIKEIPKSLGSTGRNVTAPGKGKNISRFFAIQTKMNEGLKYRKSNSSLQIQKLPKRTKLRNEMTTLHSLYAKPS